MKLAVNDSVAMISRLRRYLPLHARAHPSLLGRLKLENPQIDTTSRLYISNVYNCGASGLMCAIKLDPDSSSAPVLVAPMDQISVGRRHPIARELERYHRGSGKFR